MKSFQVNSTNSLRSFLQVTSDRVFFEWDGWFSEIFSISCPAWLTTGSEGVEKVTKGSKEVEIIWTVFSVVGELSS